MYHYAGIGQRSDSELQANNPVKYTDPDGREDIYFLYTYKATEYDQKMIVTSGHGYDAAMIQSSDGKSVSPSDINKGTELHTVIFENCYQGNYKDEWKEALGPNVDIVSWEGTMTTSETKRFNKSGIFDRQKLNLSNYVERTIRNTQRTSDLPRV